MQTHAKSGIVKPKHILSFSSVLTESEPSSFAMASKHSKWVDALTEKYKALNANGTWDLVPPNAKLLIKILLDVNGFIKSNIVLMVLLRGIRLDLWPKAFINKQVSTTMRHSVPLLNLLLHAYYYP